MTAVISNPPYNLKINPGKYSWNIDEKLLSTNANFAFVQAGMELSEDLSCYLLPIGVLSTSVDIEMEIKKKLVDKGQIQAIAVLPDKMFESTSIPICLVVFTKKPTDKILMIDLSNKGTEVIREQRGQFGGNAHTKRVYKKTVNVLDDSLIEQVAEAIRNQNACDGFSRVVSTKEIQENEYRLAPKIYIQTAAEEKHRSLEDIVSDINRFRRFKNCLKLVINGTLAKNLGLDDLIENYEKAKDINVKLNETVKAVTGLEVIKEDYLQVTKKKNQFEFQNNDPELFSEILQGVYCSWKTHVMFLNNLENIYLAELRDALLPKLMSGEIDVKNIDVDKG